MFNVKLLRILDYQFGEVYINLNYITSFRADSEDCFYTIIRLSDGSSYRIYKQYHDFVDYLLDLSKAQKGGESE